MQFISGYGNASNILLTAQKRLVRPAYAQTQGFPYAASLDPYFRNSDGTLRVPKSGDTAPISGHTRTADAFTISGSVIPGLVVVRTTGEYVAVASGVVTTAPEQPMGLLGQWVGGTFDNVGQNNQVGIWMGPDSVYELLAPAWLDTNVASTLATNAATGAQTPLYAQADGRLGIAQNTSNIAVARVIDRPSASRLLIQMLV